MCPFSDTLRVCEIGHPQGGKNVSFLRNFLLKIRSPIPGLPSGATFENPWRDFLDVIRITTLPLIPSHADVVHKIDMIRGGENRNVHVMSRAKRANDHLVST